jgi:hypothetical protein
MHSQAYPSVSSDQNIQGTLLSGQEPENGSLPMMAVSQKSAALPHLQVG